MSRVPEKMVAEFLAFRYPHVERAIEKKVIHPKYHCPTMKYDIALVKVDPILMKPLPNISPISLPCLERKKKKRQERSSRAHQKPKSASQREEDIKS